MSESKQISEDIKDKPDTTIEMGVQGNDDEEEDEDDDYQKGLRYSEVVFNIGMVRIVKHCF